MKYSITHTSGQKYHLFGCEANANTVSVRLLLTVEQAEDMLSDYDFRIAGRHKPASTVKTLNGGYLLQPANIPVELWGGKDDIGALMEEVRELRRERHLALYEREPDKWEWEVTREGVFAK